MDLRDMAPIAVILITVAIALSVGSTILSSVHDNDDCGTGYTYNATSAQCLNASGSWASGAGETYQTNSTRDGLDGLAEMSDWQDTIALVVAAAIVLGVVAFFLGRKI